MTGSRDYGGRTHRNCSALLEQLAKPAARGNLWRDAHTSRTNGRLRELAARHANSVQTDDSWWCRLHALVLPAILEPKVAEEKDLRRTTSKASETLGEELGTETRR